MKMSRTVLAAAALAGWVAFLPFAAAAVPPPTDPVALRIELDREVLAAGTAERAIVKIALACRPRLPADRRLPLNVALVIDRSGSMSGEKIARAREAALEAVDRFAADDVVALIAYDTTVETLVPAQRVGDGRLLRAAIAALEPRGNTALHGGVLRGAQELRRHRGESVSLDRVILLSDGLANVGPSSPEELGRLGAGLMREGISVTTIGLGLGYNEDLMTRLAQRSDGNTYFVAASRDLPRIFAAELGEVLAIVARRVTLRVEFSEGVRPLRIVGREGVLRGPVAEFSLSQLSGGQEKFALVEVEVAPAPAGATRDLARAAVRYEDAAAGRERRAEAQRTVRFSAATTEVIASANHRVQVDFAANEMAAATDEAIAHADAGRREAAAEAIRQRAAEISTLARRYHNSAAAAVADAAAPAAAAIERDGLDNAARKALRTSAAQVRSQQEAPQTEPSP